MLGNYEINQQLNRLWRELRCTQKCIGILPSSTCDESLFLNQCGDWVEAGGGSFTCDDVDTCLGISEGGSATLFLNQQGDFTAAETLWTKSGSNLYTTDSGDNVGIGTPIPFYKLDVVGSFNALLTDGSDNTQVNVQTGSAQITATNGGNSAIVNVAIDGTTTITTDVFNINIPSKGAGKLLMSDVDGNATWSPVLTDTLGTDIVGGFGIDTGNSESFVALFNTSTGEQAGVFARNNAGALEAEFTWTDGGADGSTVTVNSAGVTVNATMGLDSFTLAVTPTQLVLTGLQDFADDAAAAAGGIVIGGLYRETLSEYLRARKV